MSWNERVRATRKNLGPSGVEVFKWLFEREASLETFFGKLIRRAADEVIDGARTGRWSIGQLEKTEKTYIGTKLEILVRQALDLEAAPRAKRTEKRLDLVIGGTPVDVKFSISSQWMIPKEAVGELCLLVGVNEAKAVFEVGLARCERELLRAGKNQDSKCSFSAEGKKSISWLVSGGALERNFISTLSPKQREIIFEKGTNAQERIRRLFDLCRRIRIPRYAVEAVAQSKDPTRRLRQDKYNPGGLGGIVILSGKYAKKKLEKLGLAGVGADEWVGVSREEFEALE